MKRLLILLHLNSGPNVISVIKSLNVVENRMICFVSLYPCLLLSYSYLQL